jgi:hypothetical protein
MPCIKIPNGFVCGYYPFARLPLRDGRRVYIVWHIWMGPLLFHDKNQQKEILDWYEDEAIVEAVNWFHNRGCRG